MSALLKRNRKNIAPLFIMLCAFVFSLSVLNRLLADEDPLSPPVLYPDTGTQSVTHLPGIDQWFQFTLTERTSVTFVATEASLDTALLLYGPDDTNVLFNAYWPDYFTGFRLLSQVGDYALPAGTYRLQVTELAGGLVPVPFAVEFYTGTPTNPPASPPADPPPSPPQSPIATALAIGTTPQTFTHTPGVDQWYQFTLLEPSDVTFTATAASTDTALLLYGPDDPSVLINGAWPDYFTSLRVLSQTGANSLAAGIYYLSVSDLAGGLVSTAFAVEYFAMPISSIPPETNAPAPPDPMALGAGAATTPTFAGSTNDLLEIFPGTELQAFTHAVGSTQWVFFTLTQRTDLNVSLDLAGPDTTLLLYGPDSATNLSAMALADPAASWRALEATGSNALAQGTYIFGIIESSTEPTTNTYPIWFTGLASAPLPGSGLDTNGLPPTTQTPQPGGDTNSVPADAQAAQTGGTTNAVATTAQAPVIFTIQAPPPPIATPPPPTTYASSVYVKDGSRRLTTTASSVEANTTTITCRTYSAASITGLPTVDFYADNWSGQTSSWDFLSIYSGDHSAWLSYWNSASTFYTTLRQWPYGEYRTVSHKSTWNWYAGRPGSQGWQNWWMLYGTSTKEETSVANFELAVGNDAENGDTSQFVIARVYIAYAIDFVPNTNGFPGEETEIHTPVALADLAINGLPVDGDGDVVLERSKGTVEPVTVSVGVATNKGVLATSVPLTRVNLTYACHPNFNAPDAVSNKLQTVRTKFRSGAQTVFHNDYLQEVYRDTDPRVQPDPTVPLHLQRTNLYRLDDVPVKIEFLIKPSWDQEPAQDPADPPVVLVGRFPSALAAGKYYEVVNQTDVYALLLAWTPAHIKEVKSIIYTDAAGNAQPYQGMADIGGFTFLTTPGIGHEPICHEFGHASGLAHRGMRLAYQMQPNGTGTLVREEDETLPDVAGMYYSYLNPGKDPNALMRAGGGGAPMGKVNRYERGIIWNSIAVWNTTGVSGPPQ